MIPLEIILGVEDDSNSPCRQPKFPSVIWSEMLGCLDGLRYMKLSDGTMPNLSMLFPATHEPKEDSTGKPGHDQDPALCRVLAPALEELELENISFVPNSVAQYWSQKSLFDALSTRKGLRYRLTMIACKVGT